MANFFYLNAQNEQRGPVAAEDLVKNGVTKNTLVWKEGMEQWQPAGNVPELSELFAGPATPPPPGTNGPKQTPPPSPGTGGRTEIIQGIPETKPDNLLVWSILTTVLCCLPTGIVAIVYSAKVDGLWNSGQREEAMKAAKTAKTWCFVSLGAGLLFYIVWMNFVFVFGGISEMSGAMMY